MVIKSNVNIYEKPKLELFMQPIFGHHIHSNNIIFNYIVEELFTHKFTDFFSIMKETLALAEVQGKESHKAKNTV